MEAYRRVPFYACPETLCQLCWNPTFSGRHLVAPRLAARRGAKESYSIAPYLDILLVFRSPRWSTLQWGEVDQTPLPR